MSFLYNLLFPAPPIAKQSDAINIGILGAANIAYPACVAPLSLLPNGKAYAIAARDESRATTYAKKHNIPVIHKTYQDVISDPDIQAVFIPLPNGLHYEWAIEALQQGKHVLCEKPLTSNTEQAIQIKKVLEEINRQRTKEGKPNLVFAEAFHWKCHPLAHFIKDVLLRNEPGWDLGTIKEVNVNMQIPGDLFFKENDIRLDFGLAGGAMMDLCYVVSGSRYCVMWTAAQMGLAKNGISSDDEMSRIQKSVPVVESATPLKWGKDERVDAGMVCELYYPDTGIKSRTSARLRGGGYFDLDISMTIVGSEGTMVVNNFVGPFLWHSVTLKKNNGITMKKKVYGDDGNKSTYWYQMKAFLNAVQNNGAGFPEAGLTDID
ncbi:hypothetical protein HDU76_008453, partial [Blyttiomyces sp. JEL0837]